MFSYVQGAILQETSASTSVAVTLSALVINSGDLLVATFTSTDTTTTISDTSSNVWTVVAPVNHTYFAYCLNASAATSLTVTATGPNSVARFLVVDQYTPQGYAAFLGIANATIGTGTTGICGTINGDKGGNMLYGSVNTATASRTFTAGTSNNVAATIGVQTGNASGSGMSQYILGTTAGVQACTWTASGSITGQEGIEAIFADVTTTNLSPGGSRPFTFADVIHALQQDVENANQAQTLDYAFTLLTTVNEEFTATEGAITLTTSSTAAQWGTMVWGRFVWN